MINNLIFNCSSAGIAVQNQCDALLLNNTIVNCGRGIRFFDHTGRWDPPYCLVPGSGKATVVNCIIWDCPTSMLLTDSPYEEDRGSHVTVIHSNVQGGQCSMSVSANSTVTWGDGNIDIDPEFVDPGSDDYHLHAVDARWGRQVWKCRLWERVRSSAFLGDEFAYVGCDDGHIYAVDLEGGNIRWRTEKISVIGVIHTLGNRRVHIDPLRRARFRTKPGLFHANWQKFGNKILTI